MKFDCSDTDGKATVAEMSPFQLVHLLQKYIPRNLLNKNTMNLYWDGYESKRGVKYTFLEHYAGLFDIREGQLVPKPGKKQDLLERNVVKKSAMDKVHKYIKEAHNLSSTNVTGGMYQTNTFDSHYKVCEAIKTLPTEFCRDENMLILDAGCGVNLPVWCMCQFFGCAGIGV